MLFNSYVFIGFFGVIYCALLLLRRRVKAQNALLLIASYVFYGYWDWRFLSLLFISTIIDFTVGKRLVETESPSRRKRLLAFSVCANLAILGFFKYFNFFADNCAHVLSLLGIKADPITLKIILPVGISFYTFQTMSYTIDIYRGKLAPTRNAIDFALFVAFFPQLVAGPIERAVNLLPQISKERKIKSSQINAGIFLVLWGYFKKVVIADQLAIIGNEIFSNYTNYQGLDIVIGILAFTFQIYGDFSGYSDIARGVAKLMGFDLMVNFKLPYFAKNPSEFWSRWHISLSSWLRDYLYIPLGGNRKGIAVTYRNLLLTMVLGGLWHGASWNFVMWGTYHGILLILYRFFSPRNRQPERLSPVLLYGEIAIMFLLTVIGWVIFRSESLHQIVYMFSHSNLGLSEESVRIAYSLLFFSFPLIVVQIFQHRSGNLLCIANLPWYWRTLVYGFFLVWILIFGVRESVEFIYFQF